MSGVPKVPISSRVKPSTKVLIDKSKYTSGEMLDWAAQQFTDEKELVRIKIMDVEDRIQNKKIDLIADEMELENLQKMWVKLIMMLVRMRKSIRNSGKIILRI